MAKAGEMFAKKTRRMARIVRMEGVFELNMGFPVQTGRVRGQRQ